MKNLFVTILAVILVTSLSTSFMLSAFVALLPSKSDLQGSSNEALDYENMQYFDVTGVLIGNTVRLDLTDRRTGTRIEGLEFEVEGRAGTVASYVTMPALTGDREKMAWQYLLRQGFTKEGAAGLLANIASESNFLWKSNVEEGDYEGYHGEYRGENVLLKGYGLMQWTNTGGNTEGRRYRVIQYLKSRGIDPTKDSDEAFLAQLEYAITEPGYEDIVDRMKHAESATEAAKDWCINWEVPANRYAVAEVRADRARGYYSEFNDVEAYSSEPAKEDERVEETLTGEYTLEGWLGDTGMGNTQATLGKSYQQLTLEGKLASQAFGLVVWAYSGPLLGHYVKEYFEDKNQESYDAWVADTGAMIIKGIAVVQTAAQIGVTGGQGAILIEKFIKDILEMTPHNPFGKDAVPVLTSHKWRRCWQDCKLHEGMDLVGSSQIYSILPGEVVFSGLYGGYGWTVIVESTYPDGRKVKFQYSHLARCLVEDGYVAGGQAIGIQGGSGAGGDQGAYNVHLHLNYYINDALTDPRESPVVSVMKYTENIAELNLDRCCVYSDAPNACRGREGCL